MSEIMAESSGVISNLHQASEERAGQSGRPIGAMSAANWREICKMAESSGETSNSGKAGEEPAGRKGRVRAGPERSEDTAVSETMAEREGVAESNLLYRLSY